MPFVVPSLPKPGRKQKIRVPASHFTIAGTREVGSWQHEVQGKLEEKIPVLRLLSQEDSLPQVFPRKCQKFLALNATEILGPSKETFHSASQKLPTEQHTLHQIRVFSSIEVQNDPEALLDPGPCSAYHPTLQSQGTSLSYKNQSLCCF